VRKGEESQMPKVKEGPEYRPKERSRDREAHQSARRDSDYRQREQARGLHIALMMEAASTSETSENF
jgi:hypothetical protein